MKYKATIGMEVHVELKTKSKMFCGCKNSLGQEPEPNVNICPVCTGQPGALPVPNEKAIEQTIQAGLALNCEIAKESKFDRKNYFYPDLPKGYQISQYDQPICEKGWLELKEEEGGEKIKKRIRINRIHLEEDTGKLTHFKSKQESLVDFNRAGVPLMELVTEADIKTSKEARRFCEELRLVIRYLKISPADMEKGQMRCEANISLYPEGADYLSGTKVELKNLNSFKAVERGIEYEIKRQTEILNKGEKVVQATRGWDESKGKTFAQRDKEEAHDYRYFPEPDILPFKFKKDYIENLRRRLPELPNEKRTRFVRQFGLKEEQIEVLIANRKLTDYFEQVTSELEEWVGAEGHKVEEQDRNKIYQLTANYLITELARMVFESKLTMEDLKITAENFAELIKMIYLGEINSSGAQIILEEMFKTGGDPSQIVKEKDLGQVSDAGELESMVNKILADNPSAVADFKAGKENSIKFLMGQVMKETKGKANPPVVMALLKEKMKE